jgi:hypothetical protein
MGGTKADRRRDSLSEIKQLLKQKAPRLREVIHSIQSLRHSYPSIDVAESIYSDADRASIHSESAPMIASSELDFDFDDIVVDSAAYRRVMRNHASTLLLHETHEDPIGRKKGVVTNPQHEPASEKDENDRRKHERERDRTKHHARNLMQGEANVDLVEGKESLANSMNSDSGGKKLGHHHRSQERRPKDRLHRSRKPANTQIGATATPPAPESDSLQVGNDGRQNSQQEQEDGALGDLIDFTDDATTCQAAENRLSQNLAKFFEELVGLQFPATVCCS